MDSPRWSNLNLALRVVICRDKQFFFPTHNGRHRWSIVANISTYQEQSWRVILKLFGDFRVSLLFITAICFSVPWVLSYSSLRSAHARESWVSWRVGERTWERGWKEMRMDGNSCTVNHDLICKVTFKPIKNPVEEVLWRLLEISGFPYHLSHPFLLSKNKMTINGNSCAVSGDLGLRRTFALKPKPSILRRGFWK